MSKCKTCDGTGYVESSCGTCSWVCMDCNGSGGRDTGGDKTGPHGEHYAAEVQPVDLIDAMGWGDHWDRACVVKYVCRAGKKGDAAADLAKAAWHLERMRARLK